MCPVYVGVRSCTSESPHTTRMREILGSCCCCCCCCCYVVSLNHISPIHLSCLKASLDDAWLWHHRLGHANIHILHKLVKHDLVRGLPLYKYGKDRVYNECVKSKQVHASFKLLKTVSTSRCLQLFYIDLYGSIRIRSLRSSSYIFIIVVIILHLYGLSF